MLSAANMSFNDSSLWQYIKVYADIRGDSLERGVKRVGLPKTAIFSTFTHYFFSRFRGKADIIVGLTFVGKLQLPTCPL